VLFNLPEAETLPRGLTRLEWNYSFLRGNRDDRVFNAGQTTIGTRSNHRKTHLVTWRAAYGLTDRLQPEAELVYKAYRQHTHSDGDEHDRNDDGDFERIFTGLSYQAIQESVARPSVRLRGGALLPRRAETEGIGQEIGVDLLAVAGKQLGATRLTASTGFAITFANHDHPADPVFATPISKGHDLRTLTYGIGLARSLGNGWQARLELDGRAFDTIRLNRRRHESELTLTPGLLRVSEHGQWDSWIGFGVPIGLTNDTDHVGIAIRTGVSF
jgi:hypothetical protein